MIMKLYIRQVSKYIVVFILMMLVCCNKVQDEKQHYELTLLAKKAGTEFSSMMSYSLIKLSEVDLTVIDTDDQISIVEDGIHEWLTVNNYYKSGRRYFNSVIEASSAKDDLSDIFYIGFNQRQREVIDDILNIARVSSFENFHTNIESIEESITNLPISEQIELLVMVELIKGACNAAKDFEMLIDHTAIESFGDSKKDGKFLCNLTSGGIGSIYGAWAGGIAAAVFGASAIASGGITVAVGLVVGAAISTIAC